LWARKLLTGWPFFRFLGGRRNLFNAPLLIKLNEKNGGSAQSMMALGINNAECLLTSIFTLREKN
jgi:hypothetical protein